MKNRITVFVCSLIISINCIFSPCLSVHASSHGGGGGSHLQGFESWSAIDKAYFLFDNLLSITSGVCGVIFNPLNWNYEHVSNFIRQHALDVELIATSEDYFDWVASCMGVDENNNLVLSDELSDAIYHATNIYIEEYTGWYEVETVDYRQYPSSMFSTQGLYNAYLSYCTQNLKGTDNIIIVGGESSGDITGDDGVTHTGIRYALSQSLEGVEFYVKQYNKTDGCIDAYMTQEWNTIAPMYGFLFTDGGYVPNHWAGGTIQNARFYPNDWYNRRPVTDGVRIVRVYKTLEDLKSYSVGQRPYFTTSKFQDYDVNGDNSCIISESELNGSSVYGDVINYIVEYPDADGLTEDELRRILDEYFDKLPDGGGSDGGDSGGGFGDGLGGFLDGIGAIGDVILGILGKLLEYVGKAIELLSDTVMKVVDLIPKNITALVSGLFPFLPQEWLTAIELSLVLAVIVGIVGIFKK